MKGKKGLTRKIVIGAAAVFFLNFTHAQSHAEGIINVDSHKFAKAKEVYSAMLAKTPSADNYFYLGHAYLKQFEPNFEKAKENFDKGLALDRRSYLNRIGLAAVEMGRGNKSVAISSFEQIAKDSRERDAEVLFRIGEALTMFHHHYDADAGVSYLTKAVEKAYEKGSVPGNYYYTLGDAFRLKKQAGPAMTAYDNAANASVNKASVFTRMGTLWMAAQQWQKSKENLDKAIATDASYAPAYRALANYYIIYQDYDRAASVLEKYKMYADEDPNTTLEISKLYYIAKAYDKSKAELNSVFDQLDDPVKFKMKSILQFHDKDYAGAKQNMDAYLSKVSKNQQTITDTGIVGLILAGLAKEEKDAAQKSALLAESSQKIAAVKAANDTSFEWDKELASINSLGKIDLGNPDAGPTSAAIVKHKEEVAANPNDTTALYNLGRAYEEAQNWIGSAITWQKLIDVLPDWEPSYYSQGYAFQKLGKIDYAVNAYQNYLTILGTKPQADQEKNKETAAFANYNVATMIYQKDKARALEYVNKALVLKPDMKDAQNLQKILNK